MKKTHLPCPDCGSSDALTNYGDHTYCFSCGVRKKYLTDKKNDAKIREEIKKRLLSNNVELLDYNNSNNEDTNKYLHSNNVELLDYNNSNNKDTMIYTYDYLNNYRNIKRETLEKYKVKTRVLNNNPYSLEFPYSSDSFKIRKFNKKEFNTEGEFTNYLFGLSLFDPGSAKFVTLTEGEVDALSVYQMLGSKYPVLSVRSATSAQNDCKAHWKYLNSFDNIIICFDNDGSGKKAAQQVASLFDVNKVKIVELNQYKDANEYLQANKDVDFIKAWWAAKRFIPKGIIGEYSQIKGILSKEDAQSIAEYPWPTINSMSYGIRSKEVVLITAQEKVGKTEVMGAIEHHLLKTTDYNIGIIHLEESEKRSIQRLIGHELDKPVHLPDSTISPSDAFNVYESLTKREDRLYFYSHFGSDDPDIILDAIRYLVVACHCKFIFLDHITMLVTGYEGDDERKKLDYISTRLAMLTRELDFCLFLVSHVNDDGKTRGSRNIGKIADLLVHLDRDITSDSDVVRNTTTITIRGNRFASKSGPAGRLLFNPETYRLGEQDVEFKPF